MPLGRCSLPGIRLGVTVLAAGVVMAACASSDTSTPLDTVAPAITFVTVPATTTTSTTTVPTTEPPATEPTAAPSDSTTSTSTTLLQSTTTLPPTTTTTEPLAVAELLLRGDGLGSARFGAAPDGVIEYVTSILGGNTADTGWVDPFTFAACDGTVARRVDWGVLSLLFGDLSDVASGRRHFLGWEYGRVGQIGDDPVGLRTEGGTTLGSRVVDLQADFPEVVVNDGETDLNIPPNFYVSDHFRGLLTGITPEDVITVVFGGYGCAE